MSTTSTLPRPDEHTPVPAPEPTTHRLRISATQLVASALAAVTATVAASYLGVSGTVIGAAVASVVTVLGNAVYSHSIRQTGNRVRTAVPAGVRWPQLAPQSLPPAPDAPQRREREKATSLRVLAAACAGVFAAVLVLVTTVELIAGEPLSDLRRGHSGTGTSLLGGKSTPRAEHNLTPAGPQPTVTVTAKVVTTTPTVTVTAPPVTATVTPPATTATPTAPPTVATTPAPTGAPTSAGTQAPTP
ncbi:MAG: hypothetical protein ABI429_00285 [Jatrophihabitantaceae bacterium]